MTTVVEGPYFLRGDEDGGVEAVCATCELSIAWYDGRGVANPYADGEVPTAHTPHELIAYAERHVTKGHR